MLKKSVVLAKGALVQLASGGPLMIVETLWSNGEASCIWFGTGSKLRRANFSRACLLVAVAADGEPPAATKSSSWKWAVFSREPSNHRHLYRPLSSILIA